MDAALLLVASLLFTLLGVSAGIATGLLPGLHVNNIGLLLVSSQASLFVLILSLFSWAGATETDAILLVSCLIAANVITHNFLDFIPSIYLGAPEDDTALSVLPGHRMLLHGRGGEAVMLAVRGSFYGLLLSLLLLLPLRLIMGSPLNAYEALRWAIPIFLIALASFLILSEHARSIRTGKKVFRVLEIRSTDTNGVLSVKEALTSQQSEVIVRGQLMLSDERAFLCDEDHRIDIFFPSALRPSSEGEITLRTIVEDEVRSSSRLRQAGWATAVFLLSGLLGWVVLTTPGLFASSPSVLPLMTGTSGSIGLFPLFTGLFGFSTLVLSGFTRPRIPPQEPVLIRLPLRQRDLRSVLSGVIAGATVSWFPAVSGASATVVAQFLAGEKPDSEQDMARGERFLVAIGATNAATSVFTFAALFIIGRARSGAAVALRDLSVNSIDAWEPLWNFPVQLAVVLFACVTAALLSVFLAVFFAAKFARVVQRFAYDKIALAVIIFLIVLIFLFTGPLGLAIGGIATCLGLVPPLVGVRRVHLMGSLVLPVIILFL